MTAVPSSMADSCRRRWHYAALASCAYLVMAATATTPAGVAAQTLSYRFVDVRTIAGPCCTDEGNDLVVDAEGSILIAGKRGTLDLDHDGKIDVKTWGSPDPFISKVTLSGKVNTGWTLDPGGPKDDSAKGIVSDGHGGAYAVGEFNGSLHVGRETLQSTGLHDGFLIRYDRDGKPLWSRAFGGPGRDILTDVATDSAGNAILIGTFKGPVDVDRDGVVDVTGNPEGTALIASFSPAGDFRWARISQGTARVGGQSVVVGPRDEIYIGGYYGSGAPDFDGDGKPDGPSADATPPAAPRSPELNGYYARLDAKGQVMWFKAVSGAGMQAVGSLAVTETGDLLVLGGHAAPADIDGDGTADIAFKSLGVRKPRLQLDGNNFLLRVRPDGTGIWSRRYMAGGVHVTAAGSRIAVSGTYNELLDIDDDGVAERTADPDEHLEGFVAVLDGQGKVQQVLTVVGSDSDVVNAADFSSDGQYLYFTGYTRLGADFDNDGTIESASVCHQLGDIYLAVFKLG